MQALMLCWGRFFLCLLGLMWVLQAQANVSVSPTYVMLSTGTGFGSVTLQNAGFEPVQYRVVLPANWQNSIQVSPSDFTIKPGGTKVVRFKLRNPAMTWPLETPRVVFEQIINQFVPGVVQIRVNISLPLRRDSE